MTFTFLSLIGLLLLYTVLGLSGAINGNFQTSLELRRQFSQRIRLLPMQKMLTLLGIDQGRLLYQMPIADIEICVRNCESCKASIDCLQTLKQKTKQDFSYCLNHDIYSRLKQV